MTKQEWEKAKVGDIILFNNISDYKIISMNSTEATVECLKTPLPHQIKTWEKWQWDADSFSLQSAQKTNRINCIEIG